MMYQRISKRLAAALFLSSVFAVAPATAQVTVGTPSIGGLCVPFGCSYSGVYQQVYGSTAFSGPTAINTIEFLFPQYGNEWTDNTGSYTIAFYLTSQPVNGLSTNPAANQGALLSSFGTFTPGFSYTFTGNGFNYDPTLGNLLMQVTSTGTPSDSNALAYSSATNDAMSNLYRPLGGGALTTGSNGLVTRFSNTQAVPEPSTWALMLVGFFAVGAVARQRKTPVVRQIA
jgi:hypothetical protein